MKQLIKDVKNGISKNEAFESFKDRGGKPKQGSGYLAQLSEPALVHKYSKANYTLIVAYSLITILWVLSILPQLSSLSTGAIILSLAFDVLIFGGVSYLIFKGQAYGYLLLAFFMARGCLGSLEAYKNDPTSMWEIGLAIHVVILIFAVILKGKLFPKQNFFNLKKDENKNYIFNQV